jgi:hypothetical protein
VSGVLVVINSTPVRWYSKMQKTVETSIYGSELVAARIATDIAMEFRYSIRVSSWTARSTCSVIISQWFSILRFHHLNSKKKIHACAYHRVREMITCRAIRFMHCQSNLNVADVLTKPLGGFLHIRLIEPILRGDGIPELFLETKIGN